MLGSEQARALERGQVTISHVLGTRKDLSLMPDARGLVLIRPWDYIVAWWPQVVGGQGA
jgi:hypothetical protein